jgi:hypothetical protein
MDDAPCELWLTIILLDLQIYKRFIIIIIIINYLNLTYG